MRDKKLGRGVAVRYSRDIGSIYTAHVEELDLSKSAIANSEAYGLSVAIRCR